MIKQVSLIGVTVKSAFFFLILLGFPALAQAHCDSLDGPVVKDAQIALEKGDVTPVLKWVRKADETEIHDAFKRTMTVRSMGPEARKLADRYFFETLVRVHRAGEGAPYTGLKPEGTDPGKAVTLSDKALESGAVDALVDIVTHSVEKGIRERYAHAHRAKKHSEDSIEAGREFVEAYVAFVHYAERLYLDANESGGHHGEVKESSSGAGCDHHQHEMEEVGEKGAGPHDKAK